LSLTLVLTPSAKPASPKTGWRVEPGVGYGPVQLNMTPDEVLAALGPPLKREESPPLLLTLRYRGSHYWFTAPPPGESGPKRLTRIIVWDASAVTRGGIRIGSSVFRVVDIFGDYSANVQTPSTTKVLECLETYILRDNGPNNLLIRVFYLQLGIAFELALTSSRPLPMVTSMWVRQPQACRKAS